MKQEQETHKKKLSEKDFKDVFIDFKNHIRIINTHTIKINNFIINSDGDVIAVKEKVLNKLPANTIYRLIKLLADTKKDPVKNHIEQQKKIELN